MDRGAWQLTVHGVTKSWTRLSDSHTHARQNVQAGAELHFSHASQMVFIIRQVWESQYINSHHW